MKTDWAKVLLFSFLSFVLGIIVCMLLCGRMCGGATCDKGSAQCHAGAAGCGQTKAACCKKGMDHGMVEEQDEVDRLTAALERMDFEGDTTVSTANGTIHITRSSTSMRVKVEKNETTSLEQ